MAISTPFYEFITGIVSGGQVKLESYYGVPHGVLGDKAHDLFGPSSSNYHVWLRKLKKTFDHNGASEATYHVTAKE